MPIFDPTIPQPTDFVSDSQQNLLDNNVALNTTFAVNHIPLDQASNNGKHTFVQMRILPSSVPSIPGAASNEGTAFTRVDGGGTVQQYYTNAATGREYKLTNAVSIAAAADFALLGAPTNGWTWMGQGIILQYGFTAGVGGVLQPTTYPVSFVGNPYSIQFSIVSTAVPSSGRDAISDASISATGFSINSVNSANITGHYWTAVGKYGG